VRHVLKLRCESLERSQKFLDAAEKRRGKEAVQQLRDDCSAQWQRGNRGDWGVWR
jgi:hypothetical protein